VVHAFAFEQGQLTNHTRIKLRDPKQRAVPAGLAVGANPQRLFVANVWGNRVTRVDLLPQEEVADILLGTNNVPFLAPPVAAPSDFDTDAATKREEAALYQTGPDGAFPAAAALRQPMGAGGGSGH
jgi:hypothetical protein